MINKNIEALYMNIAARTETLGVISPVQLLALGEMFYLTSSKENRVTMRVGVLSHINLPSIITIGKHGVAVTDLTGITTLYGKYDHCEYMATLCLLLCMQFKRGYPVLGIVELVDSLIDAIECSETEERLRKEFDNVYRACMTVAEVCDV